MTPTQQTALESLAGRILTADEIALAGARDDDGLAKSLSVGRTRIHSPTMIGTGTILAVFQGTGGQFLDALQAAGATNRDLYWLLQGNILRGEFDVGNAASRAGMQQLAAAMPMFAAGIAALLALAVQPDPIGTGAVSDILNGV